MVEQAQRSVVTRYPERGLFICFEGGEGSGKSTQAKLLLAAIEELGYDAILTFEPGDTATGKKLRDILLSPDTGELDPRAEALLYAADKAQHLAEIVKPALAAGHVVITDRYVDSTIAYQGAGRDLDADELHTVLGWAVSGLAPNLTIVLDLPPEDGLARFQGRDRIEAEGIDFHTRVRDRFLALAAEDPEHYLVLDAQDSVLSVAAAINARVGPLLVTAIRGA